MSGPPSVSVVMPAYNGRQLLPRSLPPLLDAVGDELLEVIVVDDSSSDGSAEWAAEQGARVLHTGGRLGPGAGRNLGARAARGDVLWFVDADVVVHRDAAARVREALREDGEVAVFGSYDDDPPAAGFVSQYMNLRHHYTHHAHAGEASTFWSGCGAVRREAFLAAGGFDAEGYDRPSIEDIDLGYRLRAAGGRICLDPRILCTHLKAWGAAEALRTDIFQRAIPWTRLLFERPEAAADLNVSSAERGRALVAAGLTASVLLALARVAPWWLPLPIFAGAVAVNRPLFDVFRRRRGLPFALAAMAWHQLYYLYSSATYALCWLEHRRHRSTPDPAGS